MYYNIHELNLPTSVNVTYRIPIKKYDYRIIM